MLKQHRNTPSATLPLLCFVHFNIISNNSDVETTSQCNADSLTSSSSLTEKLNFYLSIIMVRATSTSLHFNESTEIGFSSNSITLGMTQEESRRSEEEERGQILSYSFNKTNNQRNHCCVPSSRSCIFCTTVNFRVNR